MHDLSVYFARVFNVPVPPTSVPLTNTQMPDQDEILHCGESLYAHVPTVRDYDGFSALEIEILSIHLLISTCKARNSIDEAFGQLAPQSTFSPSMTLKGLFPFLPSLTLYICSTSQNLFSFAPILTATRRTGGSPGRGGNLT